LKKSRRNLRVDIAFSVLKLSGVFLALGLAFKVVRIPSAANAVFSLALVCFASGVLVLLDSLLTRSKTLTDAASFSPTPAAVGSDGASSTVTPIRPTAWALDVFRQIEWRRFEAVVETLCQQSGFRTESQSHGADEGVDIWLYSAKAGFEPVSLVQCKHWRGKRVGVDKIRELAGVLAQKNIRRGQFVTSSTFTPEAIRFAERSPINLTDGQALLTLIFNRSAEQQAVLLRVALEGDYWRPTCVKCGIKMVSRKPRNGG
jgi:restriction system protein